MQYCLICGASSMKCLCPRCGFDLSLCTEQYPSLGLIECSQNSIHTIRDQLYRELEELRAKASALPASSTQIVLTDCLSSPTKARVPDNDTESGEKSADNGNNQPQKAQNHIEERVQPEINSTLEKGSWKCKMCGNLNRAGTFCEFCSTPNALLTKWKNATEKLR